MASASLSIASHRPLRLSTSRRGRTASSASSLAADAAIRSIRDGRRHRDGDEQEHESAIGRGVDALKSNVSATVESLGAPRWIVRVLVLGGVGIVLALAVVNTLPSLARHAVSGIATFNGRPLGNATLSFEQVTTAAKPVSRTIRTTADGSFQIDATVGLPSGIYAVAVWPAESGPAVPKNYRSPQSTPLRFDVREELKGVQLSVSDGRQLVRRNGR